MTADTARAVVVAAVDDVPPGTVHGVTVEGRSLVIVNVGGIFSALDATCTHAGGPLAEGRLVGDCVLQCPWHGAAYDLLTGDPQQAPARKAVRRHRVRISEGRILVLLDRT